VEEVEEEELLVLTREGQTVRMDKVLHLPEEVQAGQVVKEMPAEVAEAEFSAVAGIRAAREAQARMVHHSVHQMAQAVEVEVEVEVTELG
jgi:hypothetical protein